MRDIIGRAILAAAIVAFLAASLAVEMAMPPGNVPLALAMSGKG